MVHPRGVCAMFGGLWASLSSYWPVSSKLLLAGGFPENGAYKGCPLTFGKSAKISEVAAAPAPMISIANGGRQRWRGRRGLGKMFPLGSIFDARLKRAPPLVGWRVIETALGDPHERQGYARPGRIGRARLVDIRFSASGLFPPYLNQSTENRLSVIRVFFRQFAFRRREIANDFRCGKIAAGQRKTDSSESSVRFVGITPQPSRLRNAVS